MWFRGKDIATTLGYTNTTKTLKDHVNSNFKYKKIDLYTKCNEATRSVGNEKNTIYINQFGLISLLSESKMPNKELFVKWCKDSFDITYLIISRLNKEQETIGLIIRAFKHLRYQKQYPIGSYRIDLYFIDHKLAVECDENGHNDRDPKYEADRERYIRQTLQCKFVRYNPDLDNFCIFDVINSIMCMIYGD
jgi:hypothetical protein